MNYESMNYNFHVPSLKLTFFAPETDGCNTILSFWGPAYFQGRTVSFGGGVLFMYPPGKQHIPPLEKENHLPNHLWVGICEFPGGYLFIFILHGRCLYRMISGTTKAWARSCPRCGPARRGPMIEKKHRRWGRQRCIKADVKSHTLKKK